jgi:hypothetical protein
MRTASIAWGLVLLLALNLDCERSHGVLIEEIEGDHGKPLPFSLASLEARRDGARVRAGIEFRGSGASGRLLLTLELDLGPPIRLAGGDFRIWLDGKMQSGTIDADAVDFQAGQSSGMSLGGRFRLLSNRGEMLYRIVLPATAVQTPYR